MSRRMPGRPATKRKRHASEKESKFSTTKVKVARTTRCGNCLEYGHNKRACKNERKQYVPPPPKKTGRPRKHPIPHVSVPNESLNKRMTENNTTTPGQPNVPSQPSCSNIVSRSPRKHNTLRMSPRKHQQQVGSKDLGEIVLMHLGRSCAQGEVVEDWFFCQNWEIILQLRYSRECGSTSSSPLNGDNEVEDNDVIEFTEGKEDDILPEKIQVGLEDIANMLEVGYSMAEIEAMPGVQVELDDSLPVELDVNDFIDGHHSDDDVGLDGRAEGAGNEAIGDGDGPEGDADGPEGGVEELGDDEENQGDDEGHEVVPMVRRTRKTSKRITKIKLRKGVYDKDGGGSSSVKPINLE
ncbi:unnamed protein product [Lactuca virosa]|uniref:Uncharacterized protein n=1 Tax=Lactuca virosa TaxID=75947 RepID=A0AAU9PTW6_9ASTR|nr:unnamed protein product [Lactuca virosa]